MALATVISFVNHKGGVGKTTTAVLLAEFLSWRGLRVLLVDLDAQGSATAALVGRVARAQRVASRQTVAQAFRDRLSGERRFDAQLAIVRGASNVGGGLPGLDVLPSSPELTDVQDRLAFIPPAGLLTAGPAGVLGAVLAPLLEAYDYVLVDCPPNLGLLTLNALATSDGYVVPVLPDVLSTCGLADLGTRLAGVAGLPAVGVVICKYRSQSTLHRATVEELRRGPLPVFATVVPESSQLAEAADFGDRPRTLRQKYRPAAVHGLLDGLAEEFRRRVAGLPERRINAAG